MRLFAMFVVAICLLNGQDKRGATEAVPPPNSHEAAKIPPAGTNGAGDADIAKTPAPQTERLLTDGELWHLKDTMAELANLDAEYKLAEYNAKRAALLQDQMTVITPACLSVSVPQDRISYARPDGGTGSDCGITVPGKDKDGKPILGQDGRPLTGRVWNAKPAQPPAEPTAAAKAK